jgi:hypothetical protein
MTQSAAYDIVLLSTLAHSDIMRSSLISMLHSGTQSACETNFNKTPL